MAKNIKHQYINYFILSNGPIPNKEIDLRFELVEIEMTVKVAYCPSMLYNVNRHQ